MNFEELVKTASQVLKNSADFKDASIEIASEYKSYISSFGPSVIQAGLIPTIMFYLNSSGSGKEKKEEILGMICKILIETPKYKSKECVSPKDLANLALSIKKSGDDKSDYFEFVNDVLEAYAALKLSMRTYRFKKHS